MFIVRSRTRVQEGAKHAPSAIGSIFVIDCTPTAQ